MVSDLKQTSSHSGNGGLGLWLVLWLLWNKAKILPMDSKNLMDCPGWSIYHTDLIHCHSQDLWSRDTDLPGVPPQVCAWTFLHLDNLPVLPRVPAHMWRLHQALPDQLSEVAIRILLPCSIFICVTRHSLMYYVSSIVYCLLSPPNTNSTRVDTFFFILIGLSLEQYCHQAEF